MERQQQQVQNGVNSPPRRGSAVSTTSPPSNSTLIAQDPYAMTPTEKFRYEALFPKYEQGDGYVYGKVAVDLFTKSGLDKDLLRVIWNMADQPVDNRLSKLEFSLAMHMIVCVSKKNLPMPSVFPPSLKALRDQEGAVPVPVAAPTGPSEQYSSPPQLRAKQMQQSINGHGHGGAGQIPAPQQSTAAPPPPSQPQTFGVTGAMNISDAFENAAAVNSDLS